MNRPKRRYHVIISYYSDDGEKWKFQDVEERTVLAFSKDDAEIQVLADFQKGNIPKTSKYDGWDFCIEKY